MESWNNITLNLRGESVEIDGIGFSSIGRLELLTILQARVRAVGVEPRYDTIVQSVDELKGYDLIVAADGLNSLVRRGLENDFGTSLSLFAPTSSPGTARQSASRRCRRHSCKPISVPSTPITTATHPR